MRAGKGHKYWHNFSQEIQESIETLASSINRLLFDPIIQRPIKTLDLPICDRNNNILTLVYEFVSFVNNDTKEEDDLTGEATIRSLKRTERMVQLFSSVAPCSYGLHPLLYCYSNKGNFRPASFYGAIEFIRTLAYKKAPRCAICGGLLHTHSISIDHIQRKRDGGLGCVENGQLTHPYCNTGVKN